MTRPWATLLSVSLLLFALDASAARATPPASVPPGQSAASQYTEDVPTAGGNRPTSSIHRPASGPTGSGHGGGPSSGATSPITRGTAHQMSSTPAGSAAVALAQALTPTVPSSSRIRHHPPTGPHSPRSPSHRHQARTVSTAAAVHAPAAQVLRTLTGADAGSGIGVLFPIILISSLLLATGVGLLRLRRPGGGATV